MRLTVGSQIGVYEILGIIGRGGMGEVYRARDTRLDRVVALKTLPADLAHDPDRRQRFEREARLTSSLNHPNIVVVYDIGEHEGVNFIAMEYVEGETLYSLLRRGPLSAQVAAELAAQIADGLARAHGAGFIHRDLKPSNIMVTPERRAKILDFGLGKILAAESAETDVLTALGAHGPATTPGILLGTAAYMAPEQAQGRVADLRSDQFALGLILYEMLTGKHPFRRASSVQTLTAIIQDDAPPISALAPRTPEALVLIIDRCLAKDAGDRFESTTDLARALRDICDHLRSGRMLAPVVAVRKRSPRWVGAAVVGALVAAGAVAGWPYLGTGPSLLPGDKQVAVLPFTNVGGDATNQALADGLTEVLTTRLTQLERFAGSLRVVPATEVRQQQITSARDAHRVFGVNLVVSGSLQRVSDRLRVTLNVIDPATLRQVRADTLELALQDVSALQDEVLLRLTRLLDIEIAPEALAFVSAGGTRAPGAYEFYLQGRGYLQRFERAENLDVALELFQRAIRLDPDYRLAHAAIAETYWRKYEATKDAAWVERARESGQTALRLSPALAQVRVTLGLMAIGTGRYEEAITELTAALTQDPANADAYRELGRAYDALGDTVRAETTFKTAIGARPGDWTAYNSLGRFYAAHRRQADAAAQFERVVALTPDNARGYSNLGSMYGLLGQWDRAFPALEKATALDPTGPNFSNVGTAYFRQGRFPDAVRTLERATELGTKDYQVWFNLASAYQWVPAGEAKARPAFERAADLAEQERRVNPRDALLVARLAACYAHLGDRERARQLVSEAEGLAPKNARVFLLSAQVFEQIGDRGQALRRVFAALDRGLPKDEIESTRSLDALRNDPAYVATRK